MAPTLAGLVLVAVVGVVLLTRPATVPVPPAIRAETVATTPDYAGIAVSPESLASLVSRDPFRLNRRPSDVPYSPQGQPPEAVSQPTPRPQLLLTGILWGANPTAVIEGLPGTDGPRLVRSGDVVNGIRVVRILRDRATIRGPDTTWNLSIREPWR